MKKLFAILAAVGMLLMANTAKASVVGSAHEFGGGTAYGVCEVCHVPHAAQYGQRLWARTIAATVDDSTWALSQVGVLCGTCHNGGSLNAVENVFTAPASDQSTYAYDSASHKRDWNNLETAPAAAGPGGGVGDSPVNATVNGKPYCAEGGGGGIGGSDNIQCTSCHNPHQGALRPFLRPGSLAASVSGFCADCHSERYEATISATANTNNMHPIDVAYVNSAVNGGASFLASPAAALRVTVSTYDDGATPWTLGGKFEGNLTAAPTSSSIIGCQTCHAVHNPAAGTDQELHLTAIDNTGAAAALCEGCHGDGNPWGLTPTGRVGTVFGDHPIDVLAGGPGPIIDLWYTNAGDTERYERNNGNDPDDFWPRGSGGNIICTSCHSAHNSASSLGRLTRDIFVGADFCTACHSDMSPAGHHSNRYNWLPAANSAWISTDGQPGLQCSDCHGGGLPAAAHNGFSFTFDDIDNQRSNLCTGCHGSGNTLADAFDLTTDPGQVADSANMPAPHLGDGTGSYSSHYLGTFADDADSINVKRTLWVNGYSKFGSSGMHGSATDAAGLEMICESCHSVLYNCDISTSSSGYLANLLLQPYVDDSSATYAVGSGLCVACHNQDYLDNWSVNSGTGTVSGALVQNRSIVPLNMHPMTAWSITRARDDSRTPITLITTPAPPAANATYADNFVSAAAARKATGNGYVSYPAGNAMDCDSCHRPHRALSDTAWDTVAGTGVRPVIIEDGTATTYDALCLECHSY